MSEILQYILTGVTVGSIYALIALGFTIIYNTTDIINFAQGEFVMLGGIIMASLNRAFHLPLPLLFIISVLIVTFVGMCIERFAIRPVKSGSIVTLIIITIGVSIVIKAISAMLWGKDAIPLPSFSSERPVKILGSSMPSQSLWVIGVTICIMVIMTLFYRHTRIGKAMRACALNKVGASVVGIDVKKMSLIAFAISAAIGATAGALVTPIYHAGYDRGTMIGLKGFCATILGGLGSVPGGVLGGFAIGILESLGCWISSAYKDVFALAVMVLVLYIRPKGLLGK